MPEKQQKQKHASAVKNSRSLEKSIKARHTLIDLKTAVTKVDDTNTQSVHKRHKYTRGVGQYRYPGQH